MSALLRLLPSRRALRAVATMLLASACGRATAWPPVAIDVDLGSDACASCRMIVSDGRFAAQVHDRHGAVAFFDDLGCLIEVHGGEQADPQAAFVRSFDDATWLRGDEAWVVRASSIASPMGFGFAAFASVEAAEAAAAAHEEAQVLRLASLLRQGGRPPADSLASDRAGSHGDPR